MGTLYMDGIEFDEITKAELDITSDEISAKSKMFSFEPQTFSLDCDVNLETVLRCFELDTSKLPDRYDIQFIKVVQARRHKKKRINKKWAKIYGYKTITVNSKGWKIKTYTDGTFELIR